MSTKDIREFSLSTEEKDNEQESTAQKNHVLSHKECLHFAHDIASSMDAVRRNAIFYGVSARSLKFVPLDDFRFAEIG